MVSVGNDLLSLLVAFIATDKRIPGKGPARPVAILFNNIQVAIFYIYICI